MSPCGCGGPRNRVIMPARARTGNNGFYGLASYADCTQPYTGPLSGGAVFVVAAGSPDEKLFQWVEYEEAAAYATSLGLTQIDNVPITSICAEAIDALYA